MVPVLDLDWFGVQIFSKHLKKMDGENVDPEYNALWDLNEIELKYDIGIMENNCKPQYILASTISKIF